MERHFTDDLQQINAALLKMSNMTEEAIDISVQALKGLNVYLAKDVIANDTRIDEMEIEIEARWRVQGSGEEIEIKHPPHLVKLTPNTYDHLSHSLSYLL